MTNGPGKIEPRRDWIEFTYKVVTGIVLVVIPIVIKFGTDNIATSLQTGQLVQSLIEDLTTREEHARQDIALIALDGAVGEDKPEMVVRIAEQVLLSQQEFAPEDTVAYRIISDRKPVESEEILKRLKRLNPQKAETVALNVVAQEPSSRSAPAEQAAQSPAPQVSAQASKIARVFSSIVYIQFRNEENRALAVKLQQFLRGKGLFVPGVEQVDARFKNSIRFFHAEDEDLARRVRDDTMAFLEDNGRAIDFPEPIDFSKLKASRGQIEVWIEFPAAPASAAPGGTTPP